MRKKKNYESAITPDKFEEIIFALIKDGLDNILKTEYILSSRNNEINRLRGILNKKV